MSSRFFNAWQYLTPNKLIVKLPLQYPMRAQDYAFNQMEICHQGNQIILEFQKMPKDAVSNITNESIWRGEHLQKKEPIWR